MSIIDERYASFITDIKWEFGDYKEIYKYVGKWLCEARFRSRKGNMIYTFSIFGSGNLEERTKIERALGLEVLKRPKNSSKKPDIRLGGKSLEIVATSTYTKIGNLKAHLMYLGRR